MESAEPEPDVSVESIPARAARGVAVICVSVLALTAAAFEYIHPTLHLTGPPPAAAYRVSSLYFVDPSTGWVAVEFAAGGSAVLHTEDGGLSWTRQLTIPGQGRRQYLKFFDGAVGLFGLIGTAPQLMRTSDGGRSWSRLPVPRATGSVLSWSWVDSYFGWVLISGSSATSPLPAYLYRTEDGGISWQNLGVPAAPPDQVFEVDFSYFTTGWLSTANGGAYAYKTGDYGQTWTRVPLPAPASGWPEGGTFMVAAQPTSGGGVAATVVFFPTLHGRKGQGAIVRDFPPLTVGAFDGGRPVTYTYTTAVGDKNLGPIPQVAAPNQAVLGTLDDGATWKPISIPSSGAIGYIDAANWVWVGAGKLARSSDGGITWSAPSNVNVRDPLPGSLQALDAQRAWFATSDGALATTGDGGAHWRLVPLPRL